MRRGASAALLVATGGCLLFAPPWVRDGSRAERDPGRLVLWGVGEIHGVANEKLACRSSDERARGQIAAELTDAMELARKKRPLSSDVAERAAKDYLEVELKGSEIDERWEGEKDSCWSLAKLVLQPDPERRLAEFDDEARARIEAAQQAALAQLGLSAPADGGLGDAGVSESDGGAAAGDAGPADAGEPRT